MSVRPPIDLSFDRGRMIPVDQLTRPEPKAAFAYWLKRCGDKAMPIGIEIDPADIRKILSFISIVDVLHDEPMDFLYRLEGNTVRSTIGYNRSGKRLSEFQGLEAQGARRASMALNAIVHSKTPMAVSATLSVIDRGFYDVEIVMLPFSRDGTSVDRILQCFGFFMTAQQA